MLILKVLIGQNIKYMLHYLPKTVKYDWPSLLSFEKRKFPLSCYAGFQAHSAKNSKSIGQ